MRSGYLALLVLAAACQPGPATQPTHSPTETTSATDAPSPTAQPLASPTHSARPLASPEARFPISDASELTVGEEVLWMLTGDTVTGIDPATGHVAHSVDFDFEFGGMVEASGILWMPDFSASTVRPYDLTGERWLEAIDVGLHPNRHTAHDGDVWVANGHGRFVNRIDPAERVVIATWEPLSDDPVAPYWPEKAYWGTNYDHSQLYAIDSTTNTLAMELMVAPFPPCGVVPVDEAVIALPCDEASRVNGVHVLTTAAPAGEAVELPGFPLAVYPTGNFLWLPLADDAGAVSAMVALDPATGTVGDVVSFDVPATGLAIGFDRLWVSTADEVLSYPLTTIAQ